MSKYKVGIIGYFAKGKSKAGGQEVKTCALDTAIKEKYGIESVMNVDTTDWKKNPISLFTGLISMIFQCENIIMLPAQNSIKVFLPIVNCFNVFLRRKVFYSVVGGWLPNVLEKNRKLLNECKKLNCVFVETKSMQTALISLGLSNVEVFPNFKNITPLSFNEVTTCFEKPYKLCTFSRVMKEKGIEDAVEAVKLLNEKKGSLTYTLDIYGQIDPNQSEWFQSLQSEFPEYVTYKGVVEFNKSVEVIKDYYLLLFPTYYEGEGFAGTMLDAMAAGVPIVASDWKYNKELINANNGLLFQTHNVGDLANKIMSIKDIGQLKKSCLIEAQKYQPQNVIQILLNRL